jgi:hypothetical protein
VDLANAGTHQAVTGRPTPTLTETAITELGEAAGLPPEVAEPLAQGTVAGLAIGGSGAAYMRAGAGSPLRPLPARCPKNAIAADDCLPGGRPCPATQQHSEAPTISVFHKGELIEGRVGGHRPFSTGADRTGVETLERPGTVHEFRIPADVLKRWDFEGKLTRLRDLDLRTGVVNEEMRFDPSICDELNKYKVPR